VINLDKGRITGKMDDLEQCLRELDEYLGSGMRRRACERTFQLAYENLPDICHMIISGEGLGIPIDSKDAIQKLSRYDVISESLASRLEELTGFRNLLVHQYGRVDDSIAYRCLYGESRDFYEFLEEIERFITSKIGGSGERQNVTGG
jgi:uncharacterized protein YutE (UPF0331/DUF86 family)